MLISERSGLSAWTWRTQMSIYNIRLLKIIVLIVAATVLLSCSETEPPAVMEVGANPDLKAHSEEFRKGIVKVTDGVYVAIGFGLANSILLEGDDGVVIVDTLESAEAAEPVKEAFNKLSSKPVKAIIYTHYHPDHTFGTKVMAGNDNPEIISFHETQNHLDRIVSITRETTHRRAMRQFGNKLPKGGLINAGIGPHLLFDETKTPALMRPTKTFSEERIERVIAGIRLVLVHAPGETPDQIFVWLPGKKVLLPGDNFYKSFPNLYAIRGTAYRDVMRWAGSLDKMRALKAEFLVPCHTRPLKGIEKISETLTDYRDAIQYVHDQTIRWMNKGLTPDEIVEKVKLPAHLAGKPYLHEYYGTVAWSVRGIFQGYLGWFGGNATDLFPLSPGDRAAHFAAIAGGKAELLNAAKKAVEGGNYQWALELTDQLILIDSSDEEARSLKGEALKALGEKQIAATARNYYLTQALEVQNKLKITDPPSGYIDIAHSLPLDIIFKSMAVKLDPEKAAAINTIAGFRFPDTGEGYTLHVRRGVAEVQPRFPENPDISVTVNSLVWKEIAAGIRNPAVALVKDMEKEGGTLKIVKFLSLFKE